MSPIGSLLHESLFTALGSLPAGGRALTGRFIFQSRYRLATDPWDYRTRLDEHRRIQSIVAVAARHSRPTKILELGCAEGELTRALAREFPQASTVGVDISATAIERAKAQDRYGTAFHVADARTWNHDRCETADLIVVCDLLYYLGSTRQQRRFGAQLRSWLRPGGVLVLGHGADRADDLHESCGSSGGLIPLEDASTNRGSYRLAVYRSAPAVHRIASLVGEPT